MTILPSVLWGETPPLVLVGPEAPRSAPDVEKNSGLRLVSQTACDPLGRSVLCGKRSTRCGTDVHANESQAARGENVAQVAPVLFLTLPDTFFTLAADGWVPNLVFLPERSLLR